MLSLSEARQRAEAAMPEIKARFQFNDITFVERYTKEWPRGWTFIFNTELGQQTGRPQDGLVGNGPVFVDKVNSKGFLLPSGGWKRWLENYAKDADAQGIVSLSI